MPTLIQALSAVSEAATDLAENLQENIDQLTNLPKSTAEVNVYLKNLLTMLEEFAVTYGGKLIIALIIVIVGFKIVNASTRKLSRAKGFSKLETAPRNFIINAISVLIKVVIGVTALAVMGIPMTSIVAVIGSCGLAIGLALQGSLANIAGGFVLVIAKPFTIGDFIMTGDISGTVEEIGVFHTKVITIDNKRIIVPNSAISNATLVNATAMKDRRVDLTFTAAYDNDIDKVERVLLDVCRAHPLVYGEPAPFARLSAHKDSALEYTVRAWCKGEDYWTVYFDLVRDVKVAFDKNDITIPFPQVDVHSK
ncbi:MAG: mechanosensitive ion channel family protein [Clostridia bacterium]|nr:mechanosensitive ion channel family protein [Clostridia bacterium]